MKTPDAAVRAVRSFRRSHASTHVAAAVLAALALICAGSLLPYCSG